MMADITNQKIWTMKIRHEDQTLLCSDLYKKIPVKISCENTQFPPQLKSFVLMRDNKNVFGCDD